jgi:tetratricopeptide (TPR) repeat protein
MELAVLVYLPAHQLVSAQAVAEAAYKTYPSVHTLLLLANALQLQGRYPDVNRILGSKRDTYADSPEFFITLAESEFDASIYPAAQEDLEHAISLDAKSYQAHYLLGNVLARQNDADRAVAEYRLAIDLAPNQPRTYFQLALALRSRQDEAGEARTRASASGRRPLCAGPVRNRKDAARRKSPGRRGKPSQFSDRVQSTF